MSIGSLFGSYDEEPAGRIFICAAVSESPTPPHGGYTYNECGVCYGQVWVSPHQRFMMAELDAHGCHEYMVRCEAHYDAGLAAFGRPRFLDAGLEADRLALLRGATPRHSIVVVRMEDIPAIKAANPGFNPLYRF